MFFTMILWLLIFGLQAHKEERFLFPIYPLISLMAAIGIDALFRLSSKFTFLNLLSVLLFILLSLSRGYALHRNFSATTTIYKSFHDYLIINQNEMDFSQMKV